MIIPGASHTDLYDEENSAYAFDGTVLTEVDCAGGESKKLIYFHDIAKANTAENVDAMRK